MLALLTSSLACSIVRDQYHACEEQEPQQQKPQQKPQQQRNPQPSSSKVTGLDHDTRSLDDILYPEIEPYHVATLEVTPHHTLAYEECGNPRGKPVVMLHGGPGGGCSPNMRRFHDPEVYRIILVDQRGAGKSTPAASLVDNTTWDLVDDLECLRRHLNVETWQVFGGSWGSTLALAYAETYPRVVDELVLRGIFLLRRQELAFYYQHGASAIYPDVWAGYRDAIPAGDERQDFIGAYRTRLTSADPDVRLPAARAWTNWELSTSNLVPPADATSRQDIQFAEAFARIENHYFYHGGFFPTDNYLIEQVHHIRHIPTVIVQGRYDVVCPMVSAWELHTAFPESDLRVVQTAGHSAFEPGIAAELVAATKRFSTRS